MSSRNGNRARHNVNRKRRLALRAKVRVVKAAKAAPPKADA